MRKGLYLSTWLHAAKMARERVFEALFSGKPKRRRGRRGGRRRQKQQLVLCHEVRQRPVWWPVKAEALAPKSEIVQPKRWNLILEDRGSAAVLAGPIRWAFDDLLYDDGFDYSCACAGMRKAAVVASESCRFGRYGDKTQTYQDRHHEQIVERRHQVSGPSFKKFEQLAPPAVDFYDEHGVVID